MTRFEQEQLFADLARAYVRADGAALQAERAALPDPPATPELDARVARWTRASRRRRAARWVPGVAALAACLLLAVFLGNPDLLRLRSVSHAPPAAAPSATPGESTANVADGALIPLAFTLPDNLTVSAADTDKGQTIYRLADALRDDVVLTLEYAEEPDFSGLRAVALDGAEVYGRAGEGYNLLTFAQDGVVYSMTCRYDMDTLYALAEAILL